MSAQASPPVPLSTYRLQIHSEFTFRDARGLVPYLAKLGVSHVFLSPILQAVPGSTHGYDVVDHAIVSEDNGGETELRALSHELRAHGMGMIVDVVPNHMAIPTPAWRNRAWWSVLKYGARSDFAHWFDTDASADGALLLPVLARPIGAVINDDQIRVETISIPVTAHPSGGGSAPMRHERVLRYFDHVFPLAPGTEDLPLVELIEAQHYRIAYWKVGNDELNYRRFFDVETLAGVRVEDPDVFHATHATLLRLQREGIIDGYRIDHPDGLSDPRGYLRDLRQATGGAWTVIEKIVAADEYLPDDFECAGTTGYDALWRVGGLFHCPQGAVGLTRLWHTRTGDARSFDEVAHESADQIVESSLWAEIRRLTELAHRICEADIMLRDRTKRQLERAIVALLKAMDRYRAYVVPGQRAPESEQEVIFAAASRAALEVGEDEDDRATLDIVAALALGQGQFDDSGAVIADRAEFMRRFAQTCGPVHAKAVEDTAFYRYNRFLAVNEVGAHPEIIGVEPQAVHEYAKRMLETRPYAMTTLSTHDTKRSEDVRARLAALTEYPREWSALVADLHAACTEFVSARVDPAIELLVWQTLAATWEMDGCEVPRLSVERLNAYLTKAMREAKVHTAWVDGDDEYESEVLSFAARALLSPEVDALLTEWTRLTSEVQHAAILGQKLVQLTMPGVPDIYQGNESIDFSLVDPDNRRPVPFEQYQRRLEQVQGTSGAVEGIAMRKHRLVQGALRVRGMYPDAFIPREPGQASYRPIPSTTSHVFAFARAEHEEAPARTVTVVGRLMRRIVDGDGWGEDGIVIDEGAWRCVVSGRRFEGGRVMLRDLLAHASVALLVREH